MTNEYQSQRLKNVEDNKRILAELGLVNPFNKTPKVAFKNVRRSVKRKADTDISKQPRKVVIEEESGSLWKGKRRSARILGKDASDVDQDAEIDSSDDDRPRPVPKNRPNEYGAVQGVEVGRVWMMRIDCCRDGIHRPTVAGIHAGPEGAYSIALSGGYDDNVDLGEGFTYTGEGGRDLKGTKNNPKNLRTAPQSKDQELTRGNLALSRNVETRKPVRVIRGYKLDSPFAPEDGYRYDGLYSVEKSWFTTGLSGFGVWKFALKRLPNQAPPPWHFEEPSKLDLECIEDTITDKSDNDGEKEPSEKLEEKEKNKTNEETELKDSQNISENRSDDKEINIKRSETSDGDEESNNPENVSEDQLEDQTDKEGRTDANEEVAENKIKEDTTTCIMENISKNSEMINDLGGATSEEDLESENEINQNNTKSVKLDNILKEKKADNDTNSAKNEVIAETGKKLAKDAINVQNEDNKSETNAITAEDTPER